MTVLVADEGLLDDPAERMTNAAQKERYGGGYEWRAGAQEEDPAYFPGRQASVWAKGKRVGHFGIVHPEALAAFDCPYPASALELCLEPFCFDQSYHPLPTHIRMLYQGPPQGR